MKDLRILFVEDSPSDVELAAWELERNGFTISRSERVQTREDLKRALQVEVWDLVISDYSMPSFNGLEALRMVRETHPDLPYIMVSGTIGEDVAVTAMKAGANDYLMKGHLQRLAPAVEREMREAVERKRVEEALRKSEEQLRLAQRMETVGRLAGGVAHDFNNILSVVSGYANLLQMKLAKSGTAHRELLEIEKAVVKATALVRQLLTFSKRQVVQPQILDLGAVLGDSLSMLRMVVGEDIILETRLPTGLGKVKADKSQVEQIIMNLAVNAKDAMPRGGTLSITLSAENLALDHFRQGEKNQAGQYLTITIKDAGHGIPPDILPRIFEPFFTTKGEGRGTGLGLSTVYGIVHQMGANLRVESVVNQGTTFILRIPCIADTAGGDRDIAQPPIRRPHGKGETILVVEDDMDLRKLTKDILVLEGYHVLEPATPQDALGFAKSKELKIDLLLTDLVMPRMNGKELAEHVLAMRPELRVMYMSGYAPENLMPDMGLISEACFLEKPFIPAKLLAKVRTALDAPKVEKQL
jgi:two-component system, cell cycle sensor histidine kinase and response regulator CckA